MQTPHSLTFSLHFSDGQVDLCKDQRPYRVGGPNPAAGACGDVPAPDGEGRRADADGPVQTYQLQVGSGKIYWVLRCF